MKVLKLALVVGFGSDCACIPDVDPFAVGVDLKGLHLFDMAVHEASGHAARMCAVGLADTCGR